MGTCAGIGKEKRPARKKLTKTDVRASSWRSEDIKKENLCLILSSHALSNEALPVCLRVLDFFTVLHEIISKCSDSQNWAKWPPFLTQEA